MAETAVFQKNGRVNSESAFLDLTCGIKLKERQKGFNLTWKLFIRSEVKTPSGRCGAYLHIFIILTQTPAPDSAIWHPGSGIRHPASGFGPGSVACLPQNTYNL